MASSDILASIDQDIARLQRARSRLGGGAVAAPEKSCPSSGRENH